MGTEEVGAVVHPEKKNHTHTHTHKHIMPASHSKRVSNSVNDDAGTESSLLMQIQDKDEKCFHIHYTINHICDAFYFLNSHTVESFGK